MKNSIDYDQLVQKALRGVVSSVLKKVSVEGLPGRHHFYIAFRTDHPGVAIPDHLRARYPEEITIVLQHQYWDLKVYEDRFEVALSFNKKPETLVVPFEALSGFMDPSVQFGLQLQPSGVPAARIEPMPAAVPDSPEPADAPENAAKGETPKESADKETVTGGDNVVALDIFRKNAK
jgi:hypothetical protein